MSATNQEVADEFLIEQLYPHQVVSCLLTDPYEQFVKMLNQK